MLKKEWQAILKHKFFIIVIIALALVPAIYNYIFLGSMWDPYGKLNDLPVAVVNLDKTSELNGKKFKLGDDVIAEMKKSKDLDYHFVSEDKASKGIKKVIITWLSLFQKTFQKMQRL
ncbi:YhgE/Pip family protein [Lactococcus lactis]|uniref:YhgE/Pip family protein n=1 Tax=Lactococcus lactis TaxID=1358 RepID=UPI001CD84EB9|nr:YhgE/Pip family protein [Lactococcus lactis]